MTNKRQLQGVSRLCILCLFCTQALDPHANEYMDRLKDETVLLALAQKVR